MSPIDGEEDKGGGAGSKRKLNSPGEAEQGNLRKNRKTIPDKNERIRTLLAEVYDGIIVNEFVPQGIKDSTKEMKELILDIIKKEEGDKKEDKKRVVIVMDAIEELLKKPLVVCWAREKDENYEEVARNLPAIRDLSNEMLKRQEGVTIQREEIVLIDGANPNAQPPKKCLLFAASVWDGDQKKIKEDLKAIVARTEQEMANELTVIVPTDWNLVAMKEMMEVSLDGTNIKCQLRGDMEQTKIIGSKNNKATTKPKETNINVPMGTKSYAQILSELKEKVSPEDSGVEIWRTQQRKGNVKVTLKGGDKEKAKKLVEDINKRTSAGATMEVRERGMFVYNIEDDVTEAEVVRQLGLALGTDEYKMTVSFRSNNYGKAALVFTEQEAADKLCRLKFIRRSGWTNWTIKEKTNPRFCVRCQMYGHSPRDCQGEQAKSTRCMRCGECGHLQKDCDKDVFCACCDKKGHRMNSMTCPVFRRYVELERTKSDFR